MTPALPTTAVRIVEDYEADWPAIAALLDELDHYHQQLIGGKLLDGRGERDKERWAGPFARGELRILLGEASNEPVGIAIGRLGQTADELIGLFLGLYVREANRGPLMWQLDSRMLAWFKERGATKMRGSFLSANPGPKLLWESVSGTTYLTLMELKDLTPHAPQPTIMAAPAEREGADSRSDGLAVKIRSVTDYEADWPRLFSLLDELDRHHHGLIGGELLEDRGPGYKKRWQKSFERGRMHFLLAEDGDESVGVGVGRMTRNPWIFKEKVGLFTAMYIREGYRGPLMWRMHEEMLKWFRAQGAEKVHGSVLLQNEGAREVWERMGYKPYMETMERIL